MTLSHETTAPRLSIVIVNWNTEALLLRLLGQLFPAEGPPIPTEVVVVDNDSSDNSVAAARAAFPAARILEEATNGGFAKGVNRGIQAARGEFILLLNTDTEVTWPGIEQFVATAEAEPNGGVFGPRITDEHGTTQSSAWRRHGVARCFLDALGFARLLDRRPTPTEPSTVGCVSGCVFLIRRSALETTGALDERFFMYFEEADLCERMRRARFDVRYLPDTAFVHVGGLSAGKAAQRTFLAFRESRLLYHAAWHGRLLTEWVRACLLLSSALRWVGMTLGLGSRKRRHLHGAAVAMLSRPGLVKRLCAQPREVPNVESVVQTTPVG